MSGEESAHELLRTLSVEFVIPPGLLLASMRDRASVNNVTIRHVKILYPHFVDIGCFSHTLPLTSLLPLGSVYLHTVLVQEMLSKQKQGSFLCHIQPPGGGPSLRSLIKCLTVLVTFQLLSMERAYQRQQQGNFRPSLIIHSN